MRNAIQKYLDSYKIVCPSLTDEELNFIAERTTISELKNKTFYLKKDQVQNEMSFLYQNKFSIVEFFLNEIHINYFLIFC